MKRFLILLLLTASCALAARSLHAQTPAPPARKVHVMAYLQENFKGRMIRIPVPVEASENSALEKLGIPRDSIQSLIIPAGVSVTLYADDHFGGASQTFTGNAATLGDLRGATSSLKTEFVTK